MKRLLFLLSLIIVFYDAVSKEGDTIRVYKLTENGVVPILDTTGLELTPVDPKSIILDNFKNPSSSTIYYDRQAETTGIIILFVLGCVFFYLIHKFGIFALAGDYLQVQLSKWKAFLRRKNDLRANLKTNLHLKETLHNMQKLEELRKQGLLSDEEYKSLKAKIFPTQI